MSPLLDLNQQIISEQNAYNNLSGGAKNTKILEELKGNVEFDLKSLNKEREVLEVIQQDVDRTMQDYDFFTDDAFKENFKNMLYMWSKDNKEYGYRQGMNEILGIIIYAFFMEALNEVEYEDEDVQKQHGVDFSRKLDPQQVRQLSDHQITLYIFSIKYIYADIYWCFERIMSMGVRNMY